VLVGRFGRFNQAESRVLIANVCSWQLPRRQPSRYLFRVRIVKSEAGMDASDAVELRIRERSAVAVEGVHSCPAPIMAPIMMMRTMVM
jgi:hypothetical protein